MNFDSRLGWKKKCPGQRGLKAYCVPLFLWYTTLHTNRRKPRNRSKKKTLKRSSSLFIFKTDYNWQSCNSKANFIKIRNLWQYSQRLSGDTILKKGYARNVTLLLCTRWHWHFAKLSIFNFCYLLPSSPLHHNPKVSKSVSWRLRKWAKNNKRKLGV